MSLNKLGVGGYTTSPKWGSQTAKGDLPAGTAPLTRGQLSGSSPLSQNEIKSIDQKLGVLARQMKLYPIDYLPLTVAANATNEVDITTVRGTCLKDDYVLYMGAALLENGLVVQGVLPCPADDTIRIRLSNVTASDITPTIARTFYFIIVAH